MLARELRFVNVSLPKPIRLFFCSDNCVCHFGHMRLRRRFLCWHSETGPLRMRQSPAPQPSRLPQGSCRCPSASLPSAEPLQHVTLMSVEVLGKTIGDCLPHPARDPICLVVVCVQEDVQDLVTGARVGPPPAGFQEGRACCRFRNRNSGCPLHGGRDEEGDAGDLDCHDASGPDSAPVWTAVLRLDQETPQQPQQSSSSSSSPLAASSVSSPAAVTLLGHRSGNIRSWSFRNEAELFQAFVSLVSRECECRLLESFCGACFARDKAVCRFSDFGSFFGPLFLWCECFRLAVYVCQTTVYFRL